MPGKESRASVLIFIQATENRMTLEEHIQQKKFRSLEQRAIIGILSLYYRLTEEIRSAIAPYGVTLQQYNILRILRGSYPTPLSLREIRRRMIDKSSDVSRLIDRLVRKGLVNRTTCLSNRRRKEVTITEAGLQLLQQIDGVIQNLETTLLNLSQKELKELNRLLDKLLP